MPDNVPTTTDPLVIPVPGESPGATVPPSEKEKPMALDATVAGSLDGVILSQAQGHAFCMEAGRLNHLAGVISTREGLTHRIIGESGGGQARAQLPAGLGGVPTIPVKPV